MSRPTRRRLDLASSLIAKPSILFLDEPTTGFDPRSRLGMWGVIQALVDDDDDVLLSLTGHVAEVDAPAAPKVRGRARKEENA